MTKLLEIAIERLKALPDDEQDALAATLMRLTDDIETPEELDEETRAAVAEGLAQADRGEFASDEEVEAVLGRRFR